MTTFTYDHPFVSLPSEDRKDMGAFYPFVSHACHIPVVEVDVETGVVKILKYYAVNDCGTLMNPKIVEGQVMGGIVQGIGAALMEEYRYDDEDGTLQTGTLREYLLPSMHEAPEIVIDHLQTPSPFTEYGVKGAGEGGRLRGPDGDRERDRRRAQAPGRHGERAADDPGARGRRDRRGADLRVGWLRGRAAPAGSCGRGPRPPRPPRRRPSTSSRAPA